MSLSKTDNVLNHMQIGNTAGAIVSYEKYNINHKCISGKYIYTRVKTKF